MAKRVIAAVLSAGIGIAAIGPATAQDAGKPKDLVDYRNKVMHGLGNHAGAAAKLVKGKVDADHLQHHADAIAAIAPAVEDIWWDGSGPDSGVDTRAKANIWSEMDEFEDKIDDFQTAAENFQGAVDGGNRGQIIKAFKALGDSCGACHDTYRAEEEDEHEH